MASQPFPNLLVLVASRTAVIQVNDIIMQSSFSVPLKDQGKISYARENGNVCVVRSFN